MATPKVLQIISHLALGGAEEVSFTIMRGLRRQLDFEVFAVNGIQPCPVGRRYLEWATEMGIPVHSGTTLAPTRGGMLVSGMSLVRVLRTARPDLIHVHSESSEAAYAAATALWRPATSIPLVRTIHNTTWWPKWVGVGRWCERRMTHAQVACVSVGAKSSFVAAWKPAVEPRVIYNGVEADGAPARGARSDRIRIVFAGRFEDQKGAHLLPAIIRAIPPSAECLYELSIHGSGKYKRLLEELAECPPPGWLIHVGPPLPCLRDVLSSFDVLIMPSIFEGLGLTAIEALFAGVTVVATAAPGLSEVFAPAYPWLARPGDSHSFAATFVRAIAERSTWPQVVRSAALFARDRFSVSAMCNEYLKLYCDLINPAPSSSKTSRWMKVTR
jgi:glycosyltransferase involved in cell wall biosynthesis